MGPHGFICLVFKKRRRRKMLQKIIQKITGMSGLKMIIFQSLCVIFVGLVIFYITYILTGNSEIASIAAALAAFVAVAAAVVVSDYQQIKWWKVFIVYFLEGLVIFCSFRFFIPYFSVAVLVLSLLSIVGYFIVFALPEPLPEPEPVREVTFIEKIIGYRQPAALVVLDDVNRESRIRRIYRKVYNILH